mgnify:CR=1 FL=1|tara:strand:+ start:47 stop:658 length:612 start_codon:yes stop_codon:yes gene_type:complete
MEHPININISKSNEESTEHYNEFKDYIIKNNVALQRENKEHIANINELNGKIEKFEENEDKNDTRTNYLRGLLNNLNELKNDYKKITLLTDTKFKMLDNLKTNVSKIDTKCKIYMLVMYIFYILTICTIHINNVYLLCLRTLFMIFVIYGTYNIKLCNDKMNSIEKTGKQSMLDVANKIKELNEEIKKAEEACLSLDNWIYEI